MLVGLRFGVCQQATGRDPVRPSRRQRRGSVLLLAHHPQEESSGSVAVWIGWQAGTDPWLTDHQWAKLPVTYLAGKEPELGQSDTGFILLALESKTSRGVGLSSMLELPR